MRNPHGRPPTGQPRRSEAVRVLVTPDEYRRVREAAQQSSVTVSTWIRQAVLAALDRR